MADTHHHIRATVIIPAYNEATLIGHMLDQLAASTDIDSLDVIVVCNGCTDDTAAVAQHHMPSATVIDLKTPGKSNALNVGLMQRRCETVVFLDADITVSPGAIDRLVAATTQTDTALLAFGAAEYDLSGASFAVRQFYAVWRHSGYFARGKVGGFFALNAAGLRRLDHYPDIINDDEYIRRLFLYDARLVPTCRYRIKAPRTLYQIIKVRSRVQRGNAQLARGLDTPQPHRRRTLVAALLRRPSLWAAGGVFIGVELAARVRNAVMTAPPHWEQDISNRQQGIGL